MKGSGNHSLVYFSIRPMLTETSCFEPAHVTCYTADLHTVSPCLKFLPSLFTLSKSPFPSLKTLIWHRPSTVSLITFSVHWIKFLVDVCVGVLHLSVIQDHRFAKCKDLSSLVCRLGSIRVWFLGLLSWLSWISCFQIPIRHLVMSIQSVRRESRLKSALCAIRWSDNSVNLIS